MSEIDTPKLDSKSLATASSVAEYGEILLELGMQELEKILRANAFPQAPEVNIRTFEDLYFRARLPVTGRQKSYEITAYLAAKCLQPHMYSEGEGGNPLGEDFKMAYLTNPIFETLCARIVEEGVRKIPEEVRLELEKEVELISRYTWFSLGRALGRNFPEAAQLVVRALSKTAA